MTTSNRSPRPTRDAGVRDDEECARAAHQDYLASLADHVLELERYEREQDRGGER